MTRRKIHRFLCIVACCAGTALLAGAGCTSSRGTTVSVRTTSSLPPAAPDTTAFAAKLAAFMALPAAQRLELRQSTAEHLAEWQDFEQIAAKRIDRRERPFMYRDQPPDRRQLGYGLPVARDHLLAVVAADPSAAEAWAGLAHLEMEAGALVGAQGRLENAVAAAAARAASGDTVAAEVALAIARDRAWVRRDLGQWDDGLAVVAEGLATFPDDRDLVLIEGLLLAGAGRFAEAMNLATRMPPLEVRTVRGLQGFSLLMHPSDYANQWIRAQAYAAQGDPAMALHVLGEDPDQPARTSYLGGGTQGQKLATGTTMPHQVRFWNDVGQIAEGLGAASAVDYYARAWSLREYAGTYPSAMSVGGTLVLGVPDSRFPFFDSFFGRHYLLGSRFGFVASAMDRMSLASTTVAQRAFADAAFQCLDVLERRAVRLDVCHALRGRIHYRLEEWVSSRRHLADARERFEAAGVVDPRTSLLLGMLDLREQHFATAAALFDESLAADPQQALAWRMLGVAYANLERLDEAVAAMDRSLALEPVSLAGRYNRGLLMLQLQRCPEALIDLDLAQRLDPTNEEVIRLLQLAANCGRQDGRTATAVRAAGAAEVSFEADTGQLVAQLQRELTAYFTVADSLRPALEARLQLLQQAAAATDGAVLRGSEAILLSDLGRHRQCQALLAGAWPDGLRPPEDLVLLYADWRLGDTVRLNPVVAEALDGTLRSSNPYLWTLVIMEIRRDPARWGADAEARVLARWFDQSAALNGNTIRYWADTMGRELALARGEQVGGARAAAAGS